VRDVSYGEDQLHTSKPVQVLVQAQILALSLIRYQKFKYFPDGWRFASIQPQPAEAG